MDTFKAVFCCFTGQDDPTYGKISSIEGDPALQPFLEKQPFTSCSANLAYSTFDLGGHPIKPENIAGFVTSAPPPPSTTTEHSRYLNEKKIADGILDRLYAAETHESLRNDFRAEDWTDRLARHILDGLVNAINSGRVMGGAVQEAYEHVAPQVRDFVREHPILTAVVITLIAICILEYLVPWAVAALGFGELGPIEGSFAAWWQSLYGDVPYGSLFSFLQRFGMHLGSASRVDQGILDGTFNMEFVWKEYVAGEHVYTFGDEFECVDAEYDLVNNHILTDLFCAQSREALDKQLKGIIWTHSLAQILFDTLNEDNCCGDFERDGLMKEAHDKASTAAATMGFFVRAPTLSSSTRYGERSLDPFIVDLGMLHIMIPSLIKALGFAEQPVKGSFASFWPSGYSNTRYTRANVSYDSLIAFFQALDRNESV